MLHIPVLLTEVLDALALRPGELAVDCTLGAGGHALEMLKRLGPTGRLIGLDLDPRNVEQVQSLLSPTGHPFELHNSNFAGVARFVPEGCDALLADLGVSSMQIDDPGRGFSYRRPGPLDMRMDPTRGKPASQLLNTISPVDLAAAFRTLGDFDEFGPTAADDLSRAIVRRMPTTTEQLTELILATVSPPAPPPGKFVKPWQLKFRPVSCAFQALRILVNRELANLEALLRELPRVLRPGGRAAIISFHSGEDRLVKQSFRELHQRGVYDKVVADAIRAGYQERQANARSRSAKLRWAVMAASTNPS